MNAYVILKKTKILPPFLEHPRETLVGNKSVFDWQLEILKKFVFNVKTVSSVSEINDSEEYVVLADNIFFTEELFRDFIARSRELKTKTVCSLKPGLLTERTSVCLQEVGITSDCIRYKLAYFPAKEHRNTGVENIIIDTGSFVEKMSFPEHVCKGGYYDVPITNKLIAQIDHWVNLWAVNVLFSLSFVADLLNASFVKKSIFALKAHSFDRGKILGRYNKIGEGCEIHSRATCEGSIIGNNVKIRPGAVVSCSILGDNTVIEENVVVKASILGSKCLIFSGHVKYCVLYPHVLSNTKISASMFGRNSLIGVCVAITDYRLDNKNVLVKNHEGILCDSGQKFLGPCFGHDVEIGAGMKVKPGRMISGGRKFAPKK